MTQLRYRSLVFFCWCFVLYNIERLHEPINIASCVYGFAAAAAALIIGVPRLQQCRPAPLLGWLLGLQLVLTVCLGLPLAGVRLPLTVTELVATGVTVLLAHGIGSALQEFQEAVLRLTVHPRVQSRPFEGGQEDMYRELRRSRHYRRPLAVVAMTPAKDSLRASIPRMIRDAQRDALVHYTNARLGEVLSAELKDSDILTLDRKGRFIVMLPEVGKESVAQAVERLKSAGLEELGIELNFGAACFPDEEVTLVSLLDRAIGPLEGRAVTIGPTTETPAEDRCGEERMATTSDSHRRMALTLEQELAAAVSQGHLS